MGRHGLAPGRKTVWGKLGSIVASLAMVATGAVVIPALAANAADGSTANSTVPSSLVCTIDADGVPSVALPANGDGFVYAQPAEAPALDETYVATVSFQDDEAARAAVQSAGWAFVGTAPYTQAELSITLDKTNCARGDEADVTDDEADANDADSDGDAIDSEDEGETGALAVNALAAPAPAKTDYSYEDLCLSDGNPNIYVGGNFTTQGFNEVGSPFVIDGNATFGGGGGSYNGVGAASGTETWPKPGEVALRVGGSFTGKADVRGENSSSDIKVRIGETSTGTITTSNDVQADLGHDSALEQFANWKSAGVLARAAQYYLTTPATAGTAGSAAPFYNFTGSNAEQQVFTVSAADLSASGGLAMNFVNMTSTKFIIIKVTGDSPNINVPSVWVDGAQPATILDPSYQSLAKRIVWVFPDATNIKFSGSGQIPGSFIAPKANVNVTMSGGGLNGRLWAGGNVEFNVSGGWEIHLFGILSCPRPPVDVTPVAPVVTQATCDADGNVVAPKVTGTDTEAIKYSVSPSSPKAGDAVTVTATIPTSLNATFPTTLPSGWDRADDRTATYKLTLAAPNCAPQPPTATAQQCSAAGDPLEPTVTLPTNGNGITYSETVTKTAGGWTVKVTATAVGTVVIVPATDWVVVAGGKSATWTKDITAADCGLAPEEPTVTQSQCDANGLPGNPTVTLPASAGDIAYTTSNATPKAGDTVVVTAKIKSGVNKKFPDSLGNNWVVSDAGKTAKKTIVLTTPTCEIPQLADPNVTDSQCTDAGTPSTPSVALPANTTQVHYQKSGSETPGGTVVVTATAQTGFTFPATVGGDWKRISDTEARWTKTFRNPDCSITPVAPTVTEAQCLAYGQVQDPTLTFDSSNGVTYKISTGTVAAGQQVTVTATAPTGKSFPATVAGWTVAQGGRTATWTHTYKDVDCSLPLTELPKADDVICEADGTQSAAGLTVPADIPGTIVYTYDAAKVKAGETVTVTATLDPAANKRFGTLAGGWVLDTASNGQIATWTFTFDDPDCSTTVVPLDVDEAICAVDGSVIDPVIRGLPAGGTDANGVTYTVSGNVKAGEKVTVTATAPTAKKFTSVPAGWTIQPGDKTATWEYTFAPVNCDASPSVPEITDAQCSAVGDVTPPSLKYETTSGVTYAITAGSLTPGSTVTVTATAPDGKRFNTLPTGWSPVAGDPQKATWTSPAFSTPNCLVSPVLPTADQVVCQANGTPSTPKLTVPATGADGVTYEQTGTVGAGNTVTVIAKAPAKTKFDANTIDTAKWTLSDGDRVATWTFRFADPDCSAPLPAAPTADQVQCLVSGDQSQPALHGVPTDTADVEYTYDQALVAAGKTVVVTAKIKDGVNKRFPAHVNGWTIGADRKSATWSFQFDDPDCTVAPVTPQISDAQCDVDGSLRQPTLTPTVTAGVVYTFDSSKVVAGGTVTVTATAQDDVKFVQAEVEAAGWTYVDAKTATWTKSFPALNCDTAPAAVSIEDAICAVDGSVVAPKLTVPGDTNKVHYSYDPAQVKPGGTVVVTATAQDNVKFTQVDVEAAGWTYVDSKTATWTKTFNTVNCQVSPAEPDVTQAQCDLGGVPTTPVVTPASTPHVTYTVSPAPVAGGTVTVTATADDYFRFPDTVAGWDVAADHKTATKDITLTLPNCDAPAPASPVVTQAQCDVTSHDPVNPTVTLPTDATGVITYSKSGDEVPGGSVTVTATIDPSSKVRFPATLSDGWTVKAGSNGLVATKTITLDTITCDVEPVLPTATDVQCDASGDQTVPAVQVPGDTNQIVYTYDKTEVVAGGTVVVTATAQSGYAFDPAALDPLWTITAGSNDTVATWIFTFGDQDCAKLPVTPQASTVICQVDGDQSPATLTVPADGNGITYETVGTPAPGVEVQVIAHAGDKVVFPGNLAGWTVSANGKTATWTHRFENPDCTVTPVDPQVDEAQCLADGSLRQPTLTPAVTAGVVYTFDSSKVVAGGTVTVTATAQNNVKFVKADVEAAGWTFVSSKSATLDVTFADRDCENSPAEPTVAQVECTVAGDQSVPSVTLPQDAHGITYELDGTPAPGATVEVIAHAGQNVIFPSTLAGWVVTDSGKTATKTIVFADPDCTVSPVEPGVTQAQCEAGGVPSMPSVVPATTANVTYTVSPDPYAAGDTVTITAKAADHFRFPDQVTGWDVTDAGKTATKQITLDTPNCDAPALDEPTVTQAQCDATSHDPVNPTVTLPTDASGVISYQKAGAEVPGGSVTVTATIDPSSKVRFPATVSGWTVAGDGLSATKTITLDSITCEVTPVEPAATDVQCNADGDQTAPDLTVPGDTNQIVYTYDKAGVVAGGKVTVTATAQQGYEFPASLGTPWTRVSATVVTWTVEFADPDCDKSPVTPTVEDVQCTAAGSQTTPSVTKPADGNGITYEQIGTAAPGAKVDIIAHAGSKVKFANLSSAWTVSADGKTATWSHTFADPNCTPPVTTPPPTTPTVATVTPAVDGTQCIEVGELNEITVTTAERNGIVYTVRGNGSGQVTITAEAKDGFELAVPAGWTKVGDTATVTITPASDGVICVAGESSVVPSASTSVTVVQPSLEVQDEHNEIAYTGVNTMGLLSIALLLLGGGAIVLGFGTRRRGSQRQH